MAQKRQKKVLQFTYTFVVYTEFVEKLVRSMMDAVAEASSRFLVQKKWTKTKLTYDVIEDTK